MTGAFSTNFSRAIQLPPCRSVPSYRPNQPLFGNWAMQRFVTYLRVSTEKQGVSGLGLEAQRGAVLSFAASRGGQILNEHVEVESGKRHDRPALAAAIADAKRSGAVLLIAKLDRLARSVALISSLMETRVEFVAADMPDANRFVLHILAAVAEHEREQISARTKAALAAAKARGVVLGRNGQVLADRAIAEAVEFAKPLKADVQAILAGGARTLKQVADELNARGVRSREGGRWWPSNTSALLRRLDLHLPS